MQVGMLGLGRMGANMTRRLTRGGHTVTVFDLDAGRVRGVHYIDAGTSGGLWGLARGYSLIIGGPRAVVERLDPIFATTAPGDDGTPPTPGRALNGGTAARGYLHCGPSGAGHFVKMVHNILQTASGGTRPDAERFHFDLPEIAEVWRHGSVVGSWLLDLTASATRVWHVNRCAAHTRERGCRGA